MKHSNMCVCVCLLGSGTVQANVLPLEEICGLLGQMGLTIASGPKTSTQYTVLQGTVTLAALENLQKAFSCHIGAFKIKIPLINLIHDTAKIRTGLSARFFLCHCPGFDFKHVLSAEWEVLPPPHSQRQCWTEYRSCYHCGITSCSCTEGWSPPPPTHAHCYLHQRKEKSYTSKEQFL